MKRKKLFCLAAALTLSLAIAFSMMSFTAFAEYTEVDGNLSDFVTTTLADAKIEKDVSDYAFNINLTGNADTSAVGKIVIKQSLNLDNLQMNLAFAEESFNGLKVKVGYSEKYNVGSSATAEIVFTKNEDKTVSVEMTDGEQAVTIDCTKTSYVLAFNYASETATVLFDSVQLGTFDTSSRAGAFSFTGTNSKFDIIDIKSNGNSVFTAVEDNNKVTLAANPAAVTLDTDNCSFTESAQKIVSYTYDDVALDVLNGFSGNATLYVVKAADEAVKTFDTVYPAYLADKESEANLTDMSVYKKVTDSEYKVLAAGEYRMYAVVNDAVADLDLGGNKYFTFTAIAANSAAVLPSYAANDNARNTAYNSQIASIVKKNGSYVKLSSSTTFTAPTLESYVSSPYFAFAALTKKIYYKAPGSSSFSSTSTTFTLSKEGRYEYYVLFTDPANNAMTIDDEWVLTVDSVSGVYGWCEETTTDVFTLQIPVFVFEVWNEAGPTVTAGSSYQDDGYIGVRYTSVSSFTTEGVDIEISYALLFAANSDSEWYDLTDDADLAKFQAYYNWTDDEYDEIMTTLNWDSSSLAFTPVKAGEYRIVCTVTDNRGNVQKVESATISVSKEYKEVKRESEWFKYNWSSVVFLSIAALSLIGIIVLLFVPTKEKEKDSDDSND